MAVKLQEVVICDVCEKPAAQRVTLTLTVRGEKVNFSKDLCQEDLDAYVTGARPARPGRRSGVYTDAEGKKARIRRRRVSAVADGEDSEEKEPVAATA